jgi:hypothetical protein
MAEQNAHYVETDGGNALTGKVTFGAAHAVPMLAKSDGKIVRGTFDHRPHQARRKPEEWVDRRGVMYDHGVFISPSTHSLPQLATHESWTIDFEVAKQHYANIHWEGPMPTGGTGMAQHVHRVVHREMIEGKYGMTAVRPCSHCVDAEVVCRIYHSDCYKCNIPGRDTRKMLGWRCVRCRENEKLLGGCNAQFPPEKMLPGQNEFVDPD